MEEEHATPLTLGGRLKAARKEAKLTQAQLGRRVGMSQSNVSDLENDKYPSSSFTAQLAEAVGVSAIWLAEGRGKRESGELGRDEAFVRVASALDGAAIDDSLGLQPISIRLERSLIEDFKMIAELHGLGYQPLMRQALKRFAECEKKRILREMVAQRAEEKAQQARANTANSGKQKKVA